MDPMAEYYRQFGTFLGKLMTDHFTPRATKPACVRIMEKVAAARCRGDERADLSSITDAEIAAEVREYCSLHDETMDVVVAAVLEEAARRLSENRGDD